MRRVLSARWVFPRSLALAAATCATALLAPASRANNLPHLTLKQLLDSTGAVVVARAVAIDARPKVVHRSGLPTTRVTFEIDQVIAGDLARKPITFEIPGGLDPVSGRILEIPELPVFELNQSYLLFLQNGAWDHSPFVNWAGAVFKRSAINGRTLLVDQTGCGVVGVGGEGFAVGGEVEDPPGPRFRIQSLGSQEGPPQSGGEAGSLEQRRGRFAQNALAAAEADQVIRNLTAAIAVARGGAPLPAPVIISTSGLPARIAPQVEQDRLAQKAALLGGRTP
jgi:hypothetical protein